MTGLDPSSDELRARMNRHLTELHWMNNEAGPGSRRRDWPAATAVASAIPAEVTNILFVSAPISDPLPLLREAREFFGPHASWRLTAPDYLVGRLDEGAASLGMRASARVPRMVLSPIPVAPRPPAGLTVRAVTTARELRDFRVAGGRGFGIPPWILRVALPRVPARSGPSGPGIRLYVGYSDGKPVATSAQMTREGLVGVYFVATVPEARRRGYGAALTWAAIDGGRADGGTVCYLQASAMGRPVYDRMGFRWLDDYHEWVAPLRGAAQLPALLRLIRLAIRPTGPRPGGPV